MALNHDSLTGGRLSRNGDVLTVNGEATRGGDDTADIEDDDARTRRDGQGMAERAFVFGILETGDVDDFATAATTGVTSVERTWLTFEASLLTLVVSWDENYSPVTLSPWEGKLGKTEHPNSASVCLISRDDVHAPVVRVNSVEVYQRSAP